MQSDHSGSGSREFGPFRARLRVALLRVACVCFAMMAVSARVAAAEGGDGFTAREKKELIEIIMELREEVSALRKDVEALREDRSRPGREGEGRGGREGHRRDDDGDREGHHERRRDGDREGHRDGDREGRRDGDREGRRRGDEEFGERGSREDGSRRGGRSKMEKVFAAYDADADGDVTEEEFVNMHEGVRESSRVREKWEREFDRAETDGDGVLSYEEFEAYSSSRRSEGSKSGPREGAGGSRGER